MSIHKEHFLPALLFRSAPGQIVMCADKKKQKTRERLDLLLVQKGLALSRQRAQARIMAGEVRVDGKPVSKAGHWVATDADIRLVGQDNPYVSRGGLKLEAALKAFGIAVNGLVCLDVGASTGGFTDCLLRHGARQVTAVDVGYGQLHWTLRQDPRVRVMERTNIRHVGTASIEEAVDLACIDVSFISLRIVVPAVLPLVKDTGRLVCLIKPQFEVGKGLVGKGGVVRDPHLRAQVLADLSEVFRGLGLVEVGTIPSPILGPKGNEEYLAYLRKSA